MEAGLWPVQTEIKDAPVSARIERRVRKCKDRLITQGGTMTEPLEAFFFLMWVTLVTGVGGDWGVPRGVPGGDPWGDPPGDRGETLGRSLGILWGNPMLGFHGSPWD